MTINLKNVKELSEEFDNLNSVNMELKRIQSLKCRLKKQKILKTYETKMTELLKYEQILKEVKDYFVPKKQYSTSLTIQDIQNLTYDETIRAIKSIQSKKCNTQYLCENILNNQEYQNALNIEKMLLEHKQTVKPIDEINLIKKSELSDIIKSFENLETLDKDDVIEKLKKFL